ncbi:MAG: PIN domain-containing protein [Xanthomonadaceae bacterium]|nr:PIN domain-containing protein [Xanthomonadaceae bacterium]MDE1884511.1 PIN domain-containing protein [Xanthomonadaceae bacterium]MDE2084425.1 PIN domain-containing protein [Xanthomonadaceae bacterium]
MVLVDSSVWIDLLRGKHGAQIAALHDLVAANAAALSPLIYQEILQGAGSHTHLDALRKYFSTLPMLVGTHPIHTHEAAAELYARCRWAGITPRNGFDCLVAVTAIEHRAELLAHDRDFDAIARVEPRLRLYQTTGA